MQLTAKKAMIFRITHVDNVAWDVANGLQCRNAGFVNPSFRNVGNLELIEKRKSRIVPVPPGGTLSDYVPFYFTSRSPMLYNIKTGYNGIPQVAMKDIVIYAASLRGLAASGVGFVFTDRHAKLETAEFFNELTHLDRLDWAILQTSDFKHDPADPGKKDRYQAEALIHRHLPCGSLTSILCSNSSTRGRVAEVTDRRRVAVPIVVDPGAFFE